MKEDTVSSKSFKKPWQIQRDKQLSKINGSKNNIYVKSDSYRPRSRRFKKKNMRNSGSKSMIDEKRRIPTKTVGNNMKTSLYEKSIFKVISNFSESAEFIDILSSFPLSIRLDIFHLFSKVSYSRKQRLLSDKILSSFLEDNSFLIALKSLNLSYSNVTQTCLLSLIESVKTKIYKFDEQSCCSLSWEDIYNETDTIPKHTQPEFNYKAFANLEALNFSHCPRLTIYLVLECLSFRNLKAITLHHFFVGSDASFDFDILIISLRRSGAQINLLDISFNPWISPESLLSSDLLRNDGELTCLQSLKTLVLAGNPKLHESSKRHLASKPVSQVTYIPPWRRRSLFGREVSNEELSQLSRQEVPKQTDSLGSQDSKSTRKLPFFDYLVNFFKFKVVTVSEDSITVQNSSFRKLVFSNEILV